MAVNEIEVSSGFFAWLRYNVKPKGYKVNHYWFNNGREYRVQGSGLVFSDDYENGVFDHAVIVVSTNWKGVVERLVYMAATPAEQRKLETFILGLKKELDSHE